jgi:hypothetical protein
MIAWLLPVLILISMTSSAGASTCSKEQIHVKLRSYSKEGPAKWVVSFDVSDSCPDDDVVEGVNVYFTYKERSPDGSVTSNQALYLGSIHPSNSHNTVLEYPIQTQASDEIVDVYIDSVNN